MSLPALHPRRIVRWLQWRVQNRLQPINAYRGVFRSFDEAVRSAPRIKPVGYDNAGSASWYLQKMERVSLEDYPVVYWLASAFQRATSVLELGGHIGVAYYGFATILRYPAGLRWTICEVPTIAAQGAAYARERGRSDLHFVSSAADVPGADILLACGSLQYMEEDLADTLAGFRMRPRHVLLNVTPVHDGQSFITLQNLGSAYCPYRVFNRQELVGSLARVGYRLVDSWRKDREFRVPGHPQLRFGHYSGFYFRSSDE